jgi:hypothetical protein
MYSGAMQCSKWDADFTFLSNMIDLVEAGNWWMRVPRMHLALGYFKAVRKFGKGPPKLNKNIYK